MTDKEILDLANAYNEIYKTVEEDNINEAPQFTKNYGDPKAAAWNKQMQSFNTASKGKEMTPPAIPSGYRWNQQAGTIVSVTQGGAAPSAARTAPTQARPSGNLKGLSVGPGGFNINNRPVATTPRLTDAQFDKKYGVNNPPGDEFAGARKNTRVVSQPTVKPTTTLTPKPIAKPVPTAPTAKPAPTTTTPSVSPTTTSAKPSSQLADLQKMRLASQMRQKGANVVSTQMASLDLFDLVKGHLLDEGYAETEEAALAIMANMGEGWKQSIVEQMTDASTDSPSDENKSFSGEGPKKPKGWKPTGPKLKSGQRPGYAR